MKLSDMVLEQIRKDLIAGDTSAIEVLLREVSEENLRSFISELESIQ